MSYKNSYDKIYYIATNQENPQDDVRQLEELFTDYQDFIKEISPYEMDNKFKTGTKTVFESIKTKTTNLENKIFQSLSEKINKKLKKNFKIWMKTVNNTKYEYKPVDEVKLIRDCIIRFIED